MTTGQYTIKLKGTQMKDIPREQDADLSNYDPDRTAKEFSSVVHLVKQHLQIYAVIDNRHVVCALITSENGDIYFPKLSYDFEHGDILCQVHIGQYTKEPDTHVLQQMLGQHVLPHHVRLYYCTETGVVSLQASIPYERCSAAASMFERVLSNLRHALDTINRAFTPLGMQPMSDRKRLAPAC